MFLDVFLSSGIDSSRIYRLPFFGSVMSISLNKSLFFLKM